MVLAEYSSHDCKVQIAAGNEYVMLYVMLQGHCMGDYWAGGGGGGYRSTNQCMKGGGGGRGCLEGKGCHLFGLHVKLFSI